MANDKTTSSMVWSRLAHCVSALRCGLAQGFGPWSSAVFRICFGLSRRLSLTTFKVGGSLWFTVLPLFPLLFTGCLSTSESKRMQYQYDPPYGVEDMQFLRSQQALRTGLRPGNTAQLLENGDGVFLRMFEDLRRAKHSINIEVFIYDDGKVGHELAAILCERARAGVEVRVLVDDMGSRLDALETDLVTAGVKFQVYKPVRLYTLHTVEHRTHRKIVTIDGKLGYCGGFGFDDRWMGNARNPDEWRDLAVRVEGPAVAQMQHIFLEDWLHTTGEVLHGDGQFPSIPLTGDMLVQAIASSRTDQASMSKLMMYMAIQAARKRIWIANAYFVPDLQIRLALIRAAKRGVDVRAVVPGPRIDLPHILYASRYYQGELIKGGVKVLEYEPTMLHTKAMVVDGVWSTVGSINFVARSFKKNAEANVVIYDYGFASRLEKAIAADFALSRPITLEETRKRGFFHHLRELCYSLLSENY
ncbi:MAG: phospholipase D-like domain-containing protein [Verrucomicrobiota bacterium]